MSYYNYHQNIAYLDEPPFWVRIGGLPWQAKNVLAPCDELTN